MMVIIKKYVPDLFKHHGKHHNHHGNHQSRELQYRSNPFLKKTTDECKAHTKGDSCDADAGCVWCECSAVPSSCFSVEDAKKLPAAVFTCNSKRQRFGGFSNIPNEFKDMINEVE